MKDRSKKTFKLFYERKALERKLIGMVADTI